MIIILDASTLINLANGGVLNVVLSLPGVRFLVSRVVRGESKSVVSAVDAVIADGIRKPPVKAPRLVRYR
ncbi:hypothetical protein WS90_31250 [Burkholderia cepacia]|uniref:Uncharacterized protein n=1 Tax=Burkholderia cepacia TaxID=292 RepID=A0A118KDK9_BURCE|nr:hypothetical protein WS90_31250 [Burkholderia cepacia]